MKSAILASIKAFVAQVKINNFELAKKVVEKHNYTVEPKKENNNK